VPPVGLLRVPINCPSLIGFHPRDASLRYVIAHATMGTECAAAAPCWFGFHRSGRPFHASMIFSLEAVDLLFAMKRHHRLVCLHCFGSVRQMSRDGSACWRSWLLNRGYRENQIQYASPHAANKIDDRPLEFARLDIGPHPRESNAIDLARPRARARDST